MLFVSLSSAVASSSSPDPVSWQVDITVPFTRQDVSQPGWATRRNQLLSALSTRLKSRGARVTVRESPRSDQGIDDLFHVDGTGTLQQFKMAVYDDLSPVGGLLSGPTIMKLAGKVSRGEQLHVAVDSNLSTGYAWDLTQADSSLVQRTGQRELVSDTNLLGAPFKEYVTLAAVQDGDASVTLTYGRPWEGPIAVVSHVTLQSDRLAALVDLANPTSPQHAPLPSNTEQHAPILAAPQSLPTSFDWRSQTTLPAIRDQGSCGGCWAFATVGAMEAGMAIANGTPNINLSEQYLISCNLDGWSCNGGWWAHDYHESESGQKANPPGAVLESDLPYVAASTSCNATFSHPYKLSSWHYVGNSYSIPSVSSIKQAIYTNGPVAAAVCAGWGFQTYRGGVFNGDDSGTCGSGEVNHAIVLVGWNDASSTWILRNSWGSGWGESGYMEIPWTSSNVGFAANYVTYQAPQVCYSATRTSSPSNGGAVNVSTSPNCNGTQYSSGTSLTYTAVPASGYRFANWSGGLTGTANPATTTVSANTNVVANFILRTGPAWSFIPFISK